MPQPPKLTVVPPAPAPTTPKGRVRARVVRQPHVPYAVRCGKCGGAEVIVTTINLMIKGGKASGGTKQAVCVGCLLRGERVVVKEL